MKFFNRTSKSSQKGKNNKVSVPLSATAPQAIFSGIEAKNRINDRKAIATAESDKSSIIASMMLVTGNLEGAGNIAIEGKIVGNIIAQQVLIAESGQVKGDIKAQYIVVNGRAEGKLHADTVTLQRDGVIEGTIFADELVIDKGGVFMGQSQKKSLSPADKNRGKAKAAEGENRGADAAQQNEAG
ncbi:polymer-forming cytoskeletal protein [Kalamiella sp. sgz302252]|uniref:bactofilin family protein n=1 Tax=Pantoea sp. sgz302252 TaxID=3341827 RepID=UPI0036D234A4